MPRSEKPTIDKVTELHDRLVADLESLVDSDRWRDFLALAGRFHRYSPTNVMLILLQAPHATRVAGYRRWQSLGRQVRKGEPGIGIFAPCLSRAWLVDEDDAVGTPNVVRVLRGFRLTHVWDVSQTDGRPLPDVRPRLLAGDAPAGLWDALADQVAAAGYDLHRGPCGNANGITDFTTRAVTVRADVDDAQATKTLAHELAHIWLDHDHGDSAFHRGVAEVEAESVAHIVCQAAGMTTCDYSVPYVARWADGDTAAIRLTADRVVITARLLINLMEVAPALPEADS